MYVMDDDCVILDMTPRYTRSGDCNIETDKVYTQI